MPPEVVPGHCRTPKRGRPLAEVVLAAVEDTFVAVEEQEEALARKDCSADSKAPMLPYPDPPEGVAAAAEVLQMDQFPHWQGELAARRKDFHMLDQREVQERHQRDQLRSALAQEELHKDLAAALQVASGQELHTDWVRP